VNVLLVRADGIGDALACAPLVAALRAAGHEVGAVLGTANRDAFAYAAVAPVHVLERNPWPEHGSTPEARRRALAEVRLSSYDVALIATEEMDAFTFARDARVPRRIGFVNGLDKPLKTVRVWLLLTAAIQRPASATSVREHEVQTLFRLGASLTRETEPTRDVARLREIVLDGAPALHGAAVLQVSRKLAAWGLEPAAYVALASQLLALGMRVIATGDEEGVVAEVATASGAEARSGLSLSEWKTLIAGARVLITPDSGAAHVAGMVGVPCVDCFAPGISTVHDVLRWRPWAAPYRAVVLDPARPRTATGAQLAGAALELLA
jgi:ADP-heptose:LPS heptosyltransferase